MSEPETFCFNEFQESFKCQYFIPIGNKVHKVSCFTPEFVIETIIPFMKFKKSDWRLNDPENKLPSNVWDFRYIVRSENPDDEKKALAYYCRIVEDNRTSFHLPLPHVIFGPVNNVPLEKDYSKITLRELYDEMIESIEFLYWKNTHCLIVDEQTRKLYVVIKCE